MCFKCFVSGLHNFSSATFGSKMVIVYSGWLSSAKDRSAGNFGEDRSAHRLTSSALLAVSAASVCGVVCCESRMMVGSVRADLALTDLACASDAGGTGSSYACQHGSSAENRKLARLSQLLHTSCSIGWLSEFMKIRDGGSAARGSCFMEALLDPPRSVRLSKIRRLVPTRLASRNCQPFRKSLNTE